MRTDVAAKEALTFEIVISAEMALFGPRGSGTSIPLIVGVVGHRDLDPRLEPQIRERVAAFFGSLMRAYGNSTIVVYASLAVGADQLVADVAHEQGLPFVAVLPMPQALFESEFSDAERVQFSLLLAKAKRVIELPLLHGTTASAMADDTKRETLDAKEQYAALSDFLALRTHLLLALWDGSENDAIGGTAWAVNTKLSGRLRADDERLDAIEGGLVYVLPVARQSSPSVTTRPEGYCASESHESFFEALREIDIYNGHLDDAPSSADVFGHARAVADVLASRYSQRLRRVRNIMAMLIVALVVTFGIYSELWQSLIMVLSYLGVLCAGALVWTWQRRTHLEQRAVDYRALAEALRVQHVWSQSGLPQSVAGSYLRKHRGELNWIRFVLRSYATDADVVLTLATRRAAIVVQSDRSDFPVAHDWIVEQRAYFKDAERRKAARVRRIRLTARLLYAVGLIAGGASAIGLLIAAPPNAIHVMVFLMAFAPALAGILLSWLQQSGIGDEVIQARRMSVLFEGAFNDWNERPEFRLALVHELGTEAIHENADWLLLHRSRPLEAPLSPS